LIPPPSIERIRFIASLSPENTRHRGADARARLRLPDLRRPQRCATIDGSLKYSPAVEPLRFEDVPISAWRHRARNQAFRRRRFDR
jgi:hypothetical protein